MKKLISSAVCLTVFAHSPMMFGSESSVNTAEVTNSSVSTPKVSKKAFNPLSDGSYVFDVNASIYKAEYRVQNEGKRIYDTGRLYRYEIKLGKMFAPTSFLSLTSKVKLGVMSQKATQSEKSADKNNFDTADFYDLGVEQNVHLNFALSQTLTLRPFIVGSLAMGINSAEYQVTVGDLSYSLTEDTRYGRIDAGIGAELLFKQKIAPYLSFHLTRDRFDKVESEAAFPNGLTVKESYDPNIDAISKRVVLGLSVLF